MRLLLQQAITQPEKKCINARIGHTVVGGVCSFYGSLLPFLNLNSLLVTRQMTLFHQGVRMGERLVP